MQIHDMVFSGEMVLELLVAARFPGDGKTQTRRLLTAGSTRFNGNGWTEDLKAIEWDWETAWVDPGPSPTGNPGPYLKLPFPVDDPKHFLHGTAPRIYPVIQPGDLVYVRETFALGHQGTEPHECCARRADWTYHCGAEIPEGRAIKWVTPRFQQRQFSRLTLTVTRLRIERLQDLTEEDAKAEGVGFLRETGETAVQTYQRLWDKLHRRRGRGWDVNPWVLVYDFTTQKRNIDQIMQERGIVPSRFVRTVRRAKSAKT